MLIASKTPEEIIKEVKATHGFKLKGTGAVEFHLGCNYFRDNEGVLCYAPKQYIEKMMDNYKRLFGSLPKKAKTPLEPGDHPELNTSPLLDKEKTRLYQSLIGALQWVIQIGRWDVSTAVMTLSRFRACPREGHLERVKRIHGYLHKWSHGYICINVEEPDYSSLPELQYDWDHTCYGEASKAIPGNAPEPLGKPVVNITCRCKYVS